MPPEISVSQLEQTLDWISDLAGIACDITESTGQEADAKAIRLAHSKAMEIRAVTDQWRLPLHEPGRLDRLAAHAGQVIRRNEVTPRRLTGADRIYIASMTAAVMKWLANLAAAQI